MTEDMEGAIGFGGLHWEVHKFGGTSVQNAACYRRAATIVEDQMGISGNNHAPTTDHSLAVVVSAMGGKPKTTDLLLSSVEGAANRESDKVEEAIQTTLEKHRACLEILFQQEPETQTRLRNLIEKDFNDIRDILKTVALMKWQAARISELVSGYGEIWSAQILAALLQLRANERAIHDDAQPHYVYLDARRVITIDEEAIQDGAVSWDVSSEKLQRVFEGEVVPEGRRLNFVITGYVASNTDGVPTTLGRDGSDYSAAIMGKLLQARNVTIWTDVDGVLSADPRRVPSAFVIPEVSYNEAMELAYFGAKVIHPKTMQPAISAHPQIPIYIRNTFHPAFRGTRIYTSSTTHKDRAVCGFSSIESMALINVEGSGLVGVPGVAKRLFGTLESIGVNVVLISQASSEHSITFATVEGQSKLAVDAIEEEFQKELKQSRISQVEVQAPCSIIAAVGDGMKHMTGVSGLFFSALGDAGINVLAISQGCSERNISAVVFMSESSRALRAVHAAFRLSHTTVRVGVIGMGELGESLLNLLQAQRAKLREKFDVDLQVCSVVADGASNALVCLRNDKAGSTDSITTSAYSMVTGYSDKAGSTVAFDGESEIACVKDGSITSLKQHLISDDCAHHVIFDCTDDAAVGKLHVEWLNCGINVATANTWGLAASREQSDAITAAEMSRGKLSAKYLREVTIGGSLPVVNTVRSLLNSGDKIRRIDGMISVSMSYIMYRISPPLHASRMADIDDIITSGVFKDDVPLSGVGSDACSFKQAVEEAIALGLMEFDPASDFNNEYSARCMMVLAKELGLDHLTSAQEIQDESDKLVDGGVDFTNISDEVERMVQAKVKAAHEKGCVLRHVASVDVAHEHVDLKLVEVPNSHVFAITPPSCECMRFFTQRYVRYPLIIQGPSAGADSTASALLADFLSHMRSKVGPRSAALSRGNSVNLFPSSK